MPWVFDAGVAASFDNIAQRHIPNYDAVINRCLELAQDVFAQKRDAKIIDVGSARGKTVSRFIDAGFTNVYGVDASADMVAVSAHRDRIVHAENFPLDLAPFDMVLSNWTLHFIKTREGYMRDIFKGMNPGGFFIFSDRMLGSPLSYKHYLNFKRKAGVSEEEIMAKEASLVGVLEPRHLSWYQTTLRQIGFEEIEVIDGAWCFNTVMCRKPEI